MIGTDVIDIRHLGEALESDIYNYGKYLCKISWYHAINGMENMRHMVIY